MATPVTSRSISGHSLASPGARVDEALGARDREHRMVALQRDGRSTRTTELGLATCGTLGNEADEPTPIGAYFRRTTPLSNGRKAASNLGAFGGPGTPGAPRTWSTKTSVSRRTLRSDAPGILPPLVARWNAELWGYPEGLVEHVCWFLLADVGIDGVANHRRQRLMLTPASRIELLALFLCQIDLRAYCWHIQRNIQPGLFWVD